MSSQHVNDVNDSKGKNEYQLLKRGQPQGFPKRLISERSKINLQPISSVEVRPQIIGPSGEWVGGPGDSQTTSFHPNMRWPGGQAVKAAATLCTGKRNCSGRLEGRQ